jgi:2-C-methyl-D-erythritol 2,4-cyclodiphosphate synthase
MRIGHGYDVHKLVEGRKLILGGVEIPHSLGLFGHSDADVLTHAVMDALLGAAALGDIGQHFPDTDDRFLGIDSQKLLREVCRMIREAGYEVSNLDATVIAQKPKLMEYLPKMSETLAHSMDIPVSSLNLKATTEEHLGFTGRQEGIAAHCVCLLEEK